MLVAGMLLLFELDSQDMGVQVRSPQRLRAAPAHRVPAVCSPPSHSAPCRCSRCSTAGSEQRGQRPPTDKQASWCARSHCLRTETTQQQRRSKSTAELVGCVGCCVCRCGHGCCAAYNQLRTVRTGTYVGGQAGAVGSVDNPCCCSMTTAVAAPRQQLARDGRGLRQPLTALPARCALHAAQPASASISTVLRSGALRL